MLIERTNVVKASGLLMAKSQSAWSLAHRFWDFAHVGGWREPASSGCIEVLANGNVPRSPWIDRAY